MYKCFIQIKSAIILIAIFLWSLLRLSSPSSTTTVNGGYTSGGGFRIEPTLRPHVAPIPVSPKEQTEILASETSSPTTQHKNTENINNNTTTTVPPLRAPPSLLSVSELKMEPLSSSSSITHRQSSTAPPAQLQQTRPLPTLIKRERFSPPPSAFIAKSRIYPGSVDSIYSNGDQSDDSKPSPASSPNLLLWQQQQENKQSLLSASSLRRTPPLNSSELAYASSLYRYKSATATPHESLEWVHHSGYPPPPHYRSHLLNNNNNRGRNIDRFVSDTTHCGSQRDYALRNSLLELHQQHNSEQLHYSSAYAAATAERLYGSERGIMRSLPSAFSSTNSSYAVTATAAAFPSSRKRYLIDQHYGDQEARLTSTATIAEHPFKRIKLQQQEHEQERNRLVLKDVYNDGTVESDEEMLRMKRNRNFNISSLLGLEEKPAIVPENNQHTPAV